MKQTPRISETEWELMRIIWAKSPITANEVIKQLPPGEHWHPKTAKTLVNRLLKKGALKFKKQGRTYLYQPACKESDCVQAAGERFMQQCFGGSVVSLVQHFVKANKLSPTERRDLREFVK